MVYKYIIIVMFLFLNACYEFTDIDPSKQSFRFQPPGENNFFQPQSEKNNFVVYKKGEIKRTFDDVAGMETVKKSLGTIIFYLKDPKRFGYLGAVPPTGVIFYGPPGTGKTEIARALAGEVAKMRDVTFISASGGSFADKYVGSGAKNVKNLFDYARNHRPAIIFIDEFDGLAGIRSEEQKNTQMVNQLLTELDGFDENDRKDIFIIAATNHPSKIDPAIIRPGRIDRKVKIPLPDRKARLAIIKHYLRKDPEIKGINIKQLIDKTKGWSAADLKNMVNEARCEATLSNANKVSSSHFDIAMKQINQAHISLKDGENP
jgi:cell division protease FtsH